MNRPLVAVIDYDMGNLRSVAKAIELAGAKTVVTSKISDIRSADALVLPGVGAFIPALRRLRSSGLDNVICESIKSNKPFLGLCLGFQLMFDYSTEGGKRKGLSILAGGVERFDFHGRNRPLKVPHMGWNRVNAASKAASRTMFKGIPCGAYFYFVHSYYARPADKNVVAALTNYGKDFCSAVIKGKLWACQFHPEKSGPAGIRLIKNFIKEIP